MLLNVVVENYRSFKDETVFSLVAGSSRSKEHSVVSKQLANGKDDVRVLNSAVVYGANASGKSILFKALQDLQGFVIEDKPKAGEDIPIYHPFRFNTQTENAPIRIEMEFVLDAVKYAYKLVFHRKRVLEERLLYYPHGVENQLFVREINPDENGQVDTGIITVKRKKKMPVLMNQAMLSKFGDGSWPDEVVTNVFIYLRQLKVLQLYEQSVLKSLRLELMDLLGQSPTLLLKINELVRFVDTGVHGFEVDLEEEGIYPIMMRRRSRRAEGGNIMGLHHKYNTASNSYDHDFLPFTEESNGTQVLFTLGGYLINILEKGGVILIDELDAGLHSFVIKLLIQLFQDKRINTKNAQLIFSTHDTNLLDSTLFRRDQVWFAEKNRQGESELFSLQDFSDVREDTPFEKWYLAGKFGGIPNIKSLAAIFNQEHEQKESPQA